MVGHAHSARVYQQRAPSSLGTDESTFVVQDPELVTHADAVQCAKDITDELYDMMTTINADENIPYRRNSSNEQDPSEGGKPISKAEHHRVAHVRATDALMRLMHGAKWLSGKWMWRTTDPTEADKLWTGLIPSVSAGALKAAGVIGAKVKFTAQQYLFSLFIPDITATSTLTRILETLVEQHGILPTGVKPDLYTLAGITSAHPSRIDSLVFRPRDHPEGIGKINTLMAEFDQYEALLGKGSRLLDSAVAADSVLFGDIGEDSDSDTDVVELKKTPARAQGSSDVQAPHSNPFVTPRRVPHPHGNLHTPGPLINPPGFSSPWSTPHRHTTLMKDCDFAYAPITPQPTPPSRPLMHVSSYTSPASSSSAISSSPMANSVYSLGPTPAERPHGKKPTAYYTPHEHDRPSKKARLIYYDPVSR